LVFQCVGQFFLFEQLDQSFELDVDEFFVAHLDGFTEEGGPPRIL